MNKIIDTIGKILKIIFLTITIPFWGPWKLLYGFKKGEEKSYSLLPLVNTLKFVVFLMLIILELFAFHKVLYSPITYPFTRNFVRNYYLNGSILEAEGIDKNKIDSFETMLGYIDEWEIEEKNKMSVILNSDFMKDVLKYTDNTTIYYVLDKFNNDEVFRDDLKAFIKNIDKNLTRFIKEIPDEELERLNTFLNPIIAVGSWAIDYAGALNIGGAVFDWAVNKYNIAEKSLHVNSFDLEKGIKTGNDFNDGASLETVASYWK